MSSESSRNRAERAADQAAALNGDVLALAASRVAANQDLKLFLDLAKGPPDNGRKPQEDKGASDLGAAAAQATRQQEARVALVLKLSSRCDEIERVLRHAVDDLEAATDPAASRFRGIVQGMSLIRDRLKQLLATERQALDQWRALDETIVPVAKRSAAFRRTKAESRRTAELGHKMDDAITRMLSASAKAAAKP